MSPAADQPASTPWANDDQSYFDALETRRAASLRKRVVWCCIIGIFLMLIGVLGHGMELVGLRIEAGRHAADLPPLPTGADAPLTPPSVLFDPHAHGWFGAWPSTVILFCSTLTVVVMFVCVLIYTLRTKPFSEQAVAQMTGEAAPGGKVRIRTGRHRLVIALAWMSLGAIVVSVPAEIFAQWADLQYGPIDARLRVTDEPDRAGYTAANAYGIFFLLACVTVPMRIRESCRIAGPGLAVLASSLVLILMPPATVTTALLMIALAYTVLAAGWSAWRYADFDARLRAHALGTRYADLHGQVSEISAELKEARRLHESLFPPPAATDPNAPVGVCYRYQPARQIGGDFLFVHREPTGAATVVVIDVSGHGVAAALAVNRLHGELLRFFSHYPKVEREAGGPGHLLADLNTYACAALAPQGVYATAVVLRVDPAAGRAAWASAGHPTAYLLRLSGNAGDPVVDLPSTSTMLGVLPPEMYDADEHSTAMLNGDTLLAYTDGAVESRDAKGQDYTPERLRATFAELARSQRGRTLVDTLMQAIDTHRHGRISDDTLLVEIALNAAAAPPAQFATQATHARASAQT